MRSTEQDQDGSDGSDDGSDSEDEEDDTEQPTAASTEPTTAAQPSTTSPILTLLFLHLQTACTSNPSAYPTILLLLSTIPSNILSPTSETLHLLFENFWSALESRALSAGAVVSPSSKASPTEEWAAALLECLVLESGAMLKAGVEEAEVQQLVREWVGRMWLAFLGFDPTAPATGVEGKRRPRAIATPALATSLANTLAKLGARDDGGAALFEAAWEPVAASSAALVAAASVGEGTVELGGLAMGVNALAGSGSEVLREKGSELAVQCVRSAVEGVSQAEGGERSARLLQFAMDVREVVQEDAFVLEVRLSMRHGRDSRLLTFDFSAQAFDSLATSQLATLLADSTTTTLALTFLTSYLPSTSPVSRSAIWSSLYAPSPPSAAVLLRLVEAVSEGQLDVEGFPEAGLESWVLEVAGRVFGEGDEFEESEVEVLKRVMVQPRAFSLSRFFSPCGLADPSARRAVRARCPSLGPSRHARCPPTTSRTFRHCRFLPRQPRNDSRRPRRPDSSPGALPSGRLGGRRSSRARAGERGLPSSGPVRGRVRAAQLSGRGSGRGVAA